MTLALYGKSKKRQGSLLLAALLAILVASIGGLAVVTSAFAHHTEHHLVTNCTTNAWSYDADFIGGGSSGTPRRAKVYKNNVLVNTTDFTGTTNVANYYTETGSLPLGASLTFRVEMYSGASLNIDQNGEEPDDVTLAAGDPCEKPQITIVKNVRYNTGADLSHPQDFTFSVDRQSEDEVGVSPTSFTLDDDADGTRSNIQVITLPFPTGGTDSYRITETSIPGAWNLDDISCTQTAGTGVSTGDEDDDSIDIDNLGAGDKVTCTYHNEPKATIIIKKVVQGSGSDAATLFSADVVNTDGSEGDANNVAFSQNVPYLHIFNADGGDDDFEVLEDAPAGNWDLVGKRVFAGLGDCPSSTAPLTGGTNWTVATDATEAGRKLSGGVLDDIGDSDTVTVCFLNLYTQPQVIVPSVDKYNTSDGTPDLGSTFDYKLKFTVPAGGNTTAAFTAQDQIPANFTVGTVAPNSVATPLHCSNVGNLVTCVLNTNTAAGDYIATIPVTVNSNSVCGPVVNDVFKDSTTSGVKLDSDTVNITGCGSITYNKTSLGIVSGALRWNIKFTNTSVLAGSITVYDANSTYVSSTCVGGTSESPADTYTCSVPGSGTNGGIADLVLSTPLPVGYNATCDNINVSNTVAVVGASSDTAEYKQYAQPTKDCLTVTKEKSDTSQPPTWKIKIVNIADVSLNVLVKDAGATYGGTTGDGSCSGTNLTTGVSCTVNGNGTLYIIVTKTYPQATCPGTDVSNSAEVWYTSDDEESDTSEPGEPGPADWTPNGGTFEDLNKDESLCNKYIEVRKYFNNLNGYTPVAGDLPTFKLSPNPWGAGDYTITDDTHCDISGTNPVAWTCSVPVAWNGTASETVPANWVRVYTGVCELKEVEEDLIREVTGLVREVLSVVQEVPIIKLSDIFNFCNAPTANIKIIKTDLTSAANTARPADWDFTYSGTSAGGGSIGLGGGELNYVVPLGTYSAAETNGSYSQCSLIGPSGINQYFTTNLEDGPLSHTLPGQTLTFAFRNEDCGRILGTGTLVVFKVRDENGNHVLDGADSNIVWKVVITGPEFPGGQDFDVPSTGLILNGITEGVYTVKEYTDSNYKVVGVKSNETPFVALGTTTQVTLNEGDEDTVTFYNQPLGKIRAHKFAYTSHNGGPLVPALSDDDGWTITVKSALCGINQSKQTDNNGNAEFDNLPYCNDYVVSENPVNAASPGFVPNSPISISGIQPSASGNGTSVTFTNILNTTTPTCTNCPVVPTPTPVTPTVPPTTPPTTPPTASPTTKGADPTKTSVVGGEKTPGPGSPTPIAPSTGGGVLGGTAGGFNFAIILAGILALTSGLSFMALGRSRRR